MSLGICLILLGLLFLGTVLAVIGTAYMLRGIRKRIKTGKWIDTN